jgi:hypothetical protein
MKNKDARQIDEELRSLPKPTMSYESKQAIHSILQKELRSESPSKKRSESSKHFLINLAGISVFVLLAFFVLTQFKKTITSPLPNNLLLLKIRFQFTGYPTS